MSIQSLFAITLITFIAVIENVESQQACFYCNSEDLAECATLHLLDGELPRKVCTGGAAGGSCYVYIRDDGHTVRGCEDDVVGCLVNTNCNYCNDDNYCNNQLFPIDRPQCQQCNGVNCNAEHIPVHPCRLHKIASSENDYKCFSYADTTTNDILLKGCLIDHPQIDCKDEDTTCI